MDCYTLNVSLLMYVSMNVSFLQELQIWIKTFNNNLFVPFAFMLRINSSMSLAKFIRSYSGTVSRHQKIN